MIKNTSASRDELGSIVKRLREEKGSSQRMLAKESNISASYLGKIESGERKDPSVFILQDIAKALDVKIDFLLSGSHPTFEQLVYSYDFTIGNSKVINKVGKELLLQLVTAIFDKDWNNDSIFEIHKLIIELKEKLSIRGQ
ncbi:helix-turn-helix domain-containing protein [Neobacillus cucumis]|uniref:helix-turn-helix domain-containing protein n=1 Tax=Neobacillus cucumis TaxID=1740721 RepID=UPI0019652D05|nr:helix-turn-helix transcriptional regulator [Neobacillus cucumis]MBM7655296.1 transcriptional regulator with XRE-family HTH domain [Neobacillus cucumis]